MVGVALSHSQTGLKGAVSARLVEVVLSHSQSGWCDAVSQPDWLGWRCLTARPVEVVLSHSQIS